MMVSKKYKDQQNLINESTPLQQRWWAASNVSIHHLYSIYYPDKMYECCQHCNGGRIVQDDTDH